MPAIELPLFPSLLAACLVLVVGGFLAQRVPVLGRYSIPAPIIGGLIFAVLALLARHVSSLAVTFDTSAKTPFLLLFFASIGLTADLVLLRQGGVRLLRFLVALFPFLPVRYALGLTIARLLVCTRCSAWSRDQSPWSAVTGLAPPMRSALAKSTTSSA